MYCQQIYSLFLPLQAPNLYISHFLPFFISKTTTFRLRIRSAFKNIHIPTTLPLNTTHFPTQPFHTHDHDDTTQFLSTNSSSLSLHVQSRTTSSRHFSRLAIQDLLHYIQVQHPPFTLRSTSFTTATQKRFNQLVLRTPRSRLSRFIS